VTLMVGTTAPTTSSAQADASTSRAKEILLMTSFIDEAASAVNWV